MAMQFLEKNGALICRRQGETLRIEPWGKDSLRVRATMFPQLTDENWALTEKPASTTSTISYGEDAHREGDGSYSHNRYAMITNGRVAIKVNFAGVLTIFRDGK